MPIFVGVRWWGGDRGVKWECSRWKCDFSLSIAISSLWIFPLALHIEIYTASGGFLATARLLYIRWGQPRRTVCSVLSQHEYCWRAAQFVLDIIILWRIGDRKGKVANCRVDEWKTWRRVTLVLIADTSAPSSLATLLLSKKVIVYCLSNLCSPHSTRCAFIRQTDTEINTETKKNEIKHIRKRNKK